MPTWAADESEPISPAQADLLAARLRGRLLRPGAGGYDEARKTHNGAVQHRPPLIAQPLDAQDAATAVTFAREQGLDLSVRCGGHGVAGRAVAGTLVMDLSRIGHVRVDPQRRLCRAGGGALWGAVDAANEAYGLATPGGRITHTGIGGLTLGGGQGWLSSLHGLCVDNLTSAELVTADGNVIKVSDDSDPDLMWALRGGGGNFGAVTELTYRLHELGDVLAGGVSYPMEQAAELVQHYREFMQNAPAEVSGSVYLPGPPAEPLVPAHLHSRPVAVLLLIYTGPDLAKGERILRPMREAGQPLADRVQPMPYTQLQSILDPANLSGRRTYTSTAFLADLPDPMARRFLEHASNPPSRHSYCAFTRLGAAANRVPWHATAFSHREAVWMCYMDAMWDDPADDEANRDWIHAAMDVIDGYAGTGRYLNISANLDTDAVRRSYGEPTYERLTRIKTAWDPDNLFRHNANILPRR
ncbi:FAD-binding protein [Streptomyces sp. NPDC008121]|uniref:FAD-binding oxidoreductase n=1 Tax=Streptomyces sp. NPDC008121 TaxID=3364809 RepID=UPI0036EE614A